MAWLIFGVSTLENTEYFTCFALSFFIALLRIGSEARNTCVFWLGWGLSIFSYWLKYCQISEGRLNWKSAVCRRVLVKYPSLENLMLQFKYSLNRLSTSVADRFLEIFSGGIWMIEKANVETSTRLKFDRAILVLYGPFLVLLLPLCWRFVASVRFN